MSAREWEQNDVLFFCASDAGRSQHPHRIESRPKGLSAACCSEWPIKSWLFHRHSRPPERHKLRVNDVGQIGSTGSAVERWTPRSLFRFSSVLIFVYLCVWAAGWHLSVSKKNRCGLWFWAGADAAADYLVEWSLFMFIGLSNSCLDAPRNRADNYLEPVETGL